MVYKRHNIERTEVHVYKKVEMATNNRSTIFIITQTTKVTIYASQKLDWQSLAYFLFLRFCLV